MTINTEHFDVVIVGAGLSGIGAACHLQTRCPGRSYVILEGRTALGGTWDLVRYPGIRSDSDMHTLGYSFKPWLEDQAIADGASILAYLQETATEYGVEAHIRYQHRVVAARWSSADAVWRLEVQGGDPAEVVHITCNFLFMCAGYYSYRAGYTPEFVGRDDFRGTIIHPQAWPRDLDYADKRVAIIGSGATAVTMVPAMTDAAAHVTVVQRSPSYIVAWPAKDRVANSLRAVLPGRTVYRIVRWKNVTLQRFLYGQTRAHPDRIRKRLLKMARKRVGPDFDVDTHLTPRYAPWDQRLCVAPDGDFFKALESGDASMVTGHIERFTETGLLMTSGQEVDADIIITATGLNLIVLGEVAFEMDGRPVDFSKTLTYKGVAYSGVPNLCATFGYVNASWTLRADLVCTYVCRLLNHMETTGTTQCTPVLRESDHHMETLPFIDGFTPGYLERVQDQFPRQGDREPWRNDQDYPLDRKRLTEQPLEDGVMQFTHPQGS